jgi:hypothetical protein
MMEERVRRSLGSSAAAGCRGPAPTIGERWVVVGEKKKRDRWVTSGKRLSGNRKEIKYSLS